MRTGVQLGRTRLHTRRQRARLFGQGLLSLLGVAASLWLATGIVTWMSGPEWQTPQLQLRPITAGNDGGEGGLVNLPQYHEETEKVTGAATGAASESGGGAQFPVTLSWPGSPMAAGLVAVPLWLVWLRLLVAPLRPSSRKEARKEGLASPREIRTHISARAARTEGKRTRPELAGVWRWLAHACEFGVCLGTADQPRSRDTLVNDWQRPTRVIATIGWGKTFRLLVPIIRGLPGPALVSSNEPDIYNYTVAARARRRLQLRWPWLTRLFGRWLAEHDRPVWVVDFSPPDAPWAPGALRVRWNPIPGCEDLPGTATRRASALIAGIDTEERASGDNDGFFRYAAAAVLAAFFHAAAVSHLELDEVTGWLDALAKPEGTSKPIRLLERDERVDGAAVQAVKHHLDPRAERTTSGVVRYLTLALSSLISTQGRAFCGSRHGRDQFDMAGAIRERATVYLLSDTQRRGLSGPLLSLFANEMFFAAQTVAQRDGYGQRLSPPFVAVLDELRHGVTVDQLPFVAASMRKNGVSFVYAAQTTAQEDAVYGQAQANELRTAAGVSVFGGIDDGAAEQLSQLAGTQRVVRGGHGGDGITEHQVDESVLSLADQQQLEDGQAIIRARSVPLFLARCPLVFGPWWQWARRRRLQREARTAQTWESS